MAKGKYVRCNESDVPERVRFDVPRANQGQIVEIAYGGFGRYEHDVGDPYKRVIDRSIGPDAAIYYRWVPVPRRRD